MTDSRAGQMDSVQRHMPSPSEDLPPDRVPAGRVLRLSDGYETSLFVHSPPQGPASLPVVYLHGIQSHPGWFVRSAAHLAACGHPVYQVTRRGSGDNVRDRGHARSAEQLLDDVSVAIRQAVQDCDVDAVSLVGVSWGGKLAAAYSLWDARAAEIASLTLIAPGIVPRVDVSLCTKLAVAMTVLVAPRTALAIPLNDVSLFTDVPAKRHYLTDDVSRLHRATSRFMYASRRLDCMLARAADGALATPTTLLLSDRDPIIDSNATRDVVQRLAGGTAATHEFSAAHVLEFEPSPQAFHEALLAGVRRR